MVLVSLAISAVVAIILGILILVFPGVLRWAVGLYLVISGVIQLLNQYY